jgi:hypothetical protein
VGFECVQIVGFLFGMLYQPIEYIRDIEFDEIDVKGGVLPEISVEDKVQRLRTQQQE